MPKHNTLKQKLGFIDESNLNFRAKIYRTNQNQMSKQKSRENIGCDFSD